MGFALVGSESLLGSGGAAGGGAAEPGVGLRREKMLLITVLTASGPRQVTTRLLGMVGWDDGIDDKFFVVLGGGKL